MLIILDFHNLVKHDLKFFMEVRIGEVDLKIPLYDFKHIAREIEGLKDNKELFEEKSTDEIISFFHALGCFLKKKSFRKRIRHILSKMYEKSEKLIDAEIDELISFFDIKNLKELIRAELGYENILDKFVPVNKHVLVKRKPRGVIFHSLAGNTYITGPLSLMLGFLTKNTCLIKVSHEDPWFLNEFIKCFDQIDPDFKKFVSIIYYRGSDYEILENVVKNVDAIVHWGGPESEKSIRKAGAEWNIPVISHGPRFGIEYIEFCHLTQDEIKNLCKKIVDDITLWEGEACFSPKFIFVDHIDEEIIETFKNALQEQSKKIPLLKSPQKTVRYVELSQELIIEEYLNRGKVLLSDKSDWIIYYTDFKNLNLRILNDVRERTVYLVKATKKEFIEFLKNSKDLKQFYQTLGYNGKDLNFIEEVAKAGIFHICEPGFMGVKIGGSSHDGIYNLAELTIPVSIQKVEEV